MLVSTSSLGTERPCSRSILAPRPLLLLPYFGTGRRRSGQFQEQTCPFPLHSFVQRGLRGVLLEFLLLIGAQVLPPRLTAGTGQTLMTSGLATRGSPPVGLHAFPALPALVLLVAIKLIRTRVEEE